jgi:hypothetical protein
MTSKAAAARTKIIADPTENIYYVESSNGYDLYMVQMTAPGCAVCCCKAASVGRQCRHRAQVLKAHSYVVPNAAARWEALEQGLAELRGMFAAAEAEAELDAVREMNEAA